MSKYGIIILAAGGSSRLGKPKQLLLYRGKPLIQNIIDAAEAVPELYTIVVTGAVPIEVNVHSCYNEEWPSGIASTIRQGLSELLKLQPQAAACIITVCDQPFITAEVLSSLIVRHEETGSGIAASGYAGTVGTPALFSSQYFDELLQLRGDEGAKKVIKKYAHDVAILPFPGGETDIDTAQDYQRLT